MAFSGALVFHKDILFDLYLFCCLQILSIRISLKFCEKKLSDFLLT